MQYNYDNNVALRKESVDRNNLHCVEEVSGDTVALRKESVDRNGLGFCYHRDDVTVALRKESVDRNSCPLSISCWLLGRSPQGERG